MNFSLHNSYPQARKEEEEYTSFSDEDEAVASDLDMHSLILGRSHDNEPEPPTADEVIKEIDFIMQVSTQSHSFYTPWITALKGNYSDRVFRNAHISAKVFPRFDCTA